MHGMGVFRWPDGREYHGEYSNDKKHGKGTIVSAHGRKKEGVWAFGRYVRTSEVKRNSKDGLMKDSKSSGNIHKKQ